MRYCLRLFFYLYFLHKLPLTERGDTMDLKNNQIKLGVLLDNPKSRAVLQKNFGALLSHPMLSMARNMTLQKIIEMGGSKLSPQIVKQTLEELRNI